MQLRLIDNQPVEIHSARVAGMIDIDDEDVSSFATDNTLVLAVVVTVDVPSFKRTASADIKRVNVLHVESMRVVDGPLRDTLLDTMGISRQESLPAMDPSPIASMSTVVPGNVLTNDVPVPETGTVLTNKVPETDPNRVGRDMLRDFLDEVPA